MRPFQHARASAARFGRSWRDDLAVHEFIDSSKAAVPDLRHRMVLHSVDLGAELAARAFPERDDVQLLVTNHVVEDIGTPRTFQEWLDHCRTDRFPRLYPGALPLDETAIAESERHRFGLADADAIRQVIEILFLPLRFAPGHGEIGLAVLCNAFGVSLVQRIMGPPREARSTGDGAPAIFDPGWCAEAIVHRMYRGIPDLRAVVAALRATHQMGGE